MIMNVEILIPKFLDANVDVWESSDGAVLTEDDGALILSIFSVAAILMAPINSIIKTTLGAKNAFVVGFLLLTVTTIGLGAIKHIINPHVFKWVALFLRFI